MTRVFTALEFGFDRVQMIFTTGQDMYGLLFRVNSVRMRIAQRGVVDLSSSSHACRVLGINPN